MKWEPAVARTEVGVILPPPKKGDAAPRPAARSGDSRAE